MIVRKYHHRCSLRLRCAGQCRHCVAGRPMQHSASSSRCPASHQDPVDLHPPHIGPSRCRCRVTKVRTRVMPASLKARFCRPLAGVYTCAVLGSPCLYSLWNCYVSFSTVANMADPEAVGKAFLQYYYQLFESNRQGLANLYQDASMLTFEGQKFQGTQAIVGKLAQLPFNQCKVNPTSMDFQPSVSGGVMVFVTGAILAEGETNPLKFSQVFHLMPVGSSFVVTNDMFRLNYG